MKRKKSNCRTRYKLAICSQRLFGKTVISQINEHINRNFLSKPMAWALQFTHFFKKDFCLCAFSAYLRRCYTDGVSKYRLFNRKKKIWIKSLSIKQAWFINYSQASELFPKWLPLPTGKWQFSTRKLSIPKDFLKENGFSLTTLGSEDTFSWHTKPQAPICHHSTSSSQYQWRDSTLTHIYSG